MALRATCALSRCVRPKPAAVAAALGVLSSNCGSHSANVSVTLPRLGKGLAWATERRAHPNRGGIRTRQASSAAAAVPPAMTSSDVPWKIELVPCLKDNYAYLILNPETKTAAVVDPSESGPVAAAAGKQGLRLTHVLCTHHHWDHTGGNLDLKAKYGAKVVGPAADKDRIPGIDIPLADGEVWKLGDLEIHTLHTPGHTRGHCSYYIPQLQAVFTGDTLFSLGCGRLFEGTPEQMWSSLSRLSALPVSTKVYCGHEYTLSNAKFALSVESGNTNLQAKLDQIKSLRSQNKPTIPSTIEEELSVNPFLRTGSEQMRSSLKLSSLASDIEVFAAARRAKDQF